MIDRRDISIESGPRCCRPIRGGGLGTIVLLVIAGLALAGLAALLIGTSSSAGTGESGEQYRVRRTNFEISIPASGELAALNQVQIRNPLEFTATIVEIVPEGTMVKTGDVLLKLSDDKIQNDVKDMELNVLSAQAALSAAENALAIQISTNESELSAAELKVALANLALEQWEKGDVVSKRQALAVARETGERNYTRLKEKFEASMRLLEQEFISRDEYESDRIAVIEAEAKLRQAILDIEVYEKYQFVRDQKQFTSDVEQAQDELKRVKDRHAADLKSKQTDVDKARGQLEIREASLAKLRKQYAACTVTAPKDGLVVYASSMEGGGMRGNDKVTPQVGGEIRGNEPVIIIPDTSQIVAAVKVNESLSGLVMPGQRATITSDALPDVPLAGEVLSVGVLAESGGWRDPNRRDYTVRIKLLGGQEAGLKPSMRCSAEIFIGQVSDTLAVPIQAVFRSGGLAFVYVPQGSGFAEREIRVGRSSELFVEVLEGVSENEEVLLREPSPERVVFKLPRSERETEPTAEEEQAPEITAASAPPSMPGMGEGGREGMGDRTDGDRGNRPGSGRRDQGRDGGEMPASADEAKPDAPRTGESTGAPSAK
jgi:HlyD family secretion protein